MDAILFDLGDTLINFHGVNSKALFQSASEQTYLHHQARGAKLPDRERYFNLHYRRVMRSYVWSYLTGREFNSQDLMEEVARKLGIPTDDDSLRETCWMWYQPAVGCSSVQPGLVEMLSDLRASGVKLGIVSNTFAPPHCLDRHLEAEGLLEFFPVRVYSCVTRYKKPHKKIFHAAFEQMGLTPEKTLFVGDLHQTDIVGATGVGMKTVWKPVPGRKNNPVRHLATRVIEKITDLPGVLPGLGFAAREMAAAG